MGPGPNGPGPKWDPGPIGPGPKWWSISEVGGSETNREIVSFRVVRACARSGCLVRSGVNSKSGVFPFSIFPQAAFPFPL